jgi:hypothetical protein
LEFEYSDWCQAETALAPHSGRADREPGAHRPDNAPLAEPYVARAVTAPNLELRELAVGER